MIETEIGKIVPLKEKIQVWDLLKRKNLNLAERLLSRHGNYAQRLEKCCELLKFNVCHNGYLLLKDFQCCRVRGCPICEWRRFGSIARQVYKAAQEIIDFYPAHRYMSISLPLPPSKASNLPEALNNLHLSYRRLKQLKVWIPDGCLTFIDVSFWNDVSLLKLNCLCLMPSHYFGKEYISRKKWNEVWSQSLRLDTPSDVEVHNLGKLSIKDVAQHAKKLNRGLDLSLCSDESLVDVINSLHKQKMFTASGAFKEYLSFGDKQARKYYSSEKKAIQAMQRVYYANLPNPEDDQHLEQYLMLNELPSFEEC